MKHPVLILGGSASFSFGSELIFEPSLVKGAALAGPQVPGLKLLSMSAHLSKTP